MNDQAPWARDDFFSCGNVLGGRTAGFALLIPHFNGASIIPQKLVLN
jgi:hypothetical protein